MRQSASPNLLAVVAALIVLGTACSGPREPVKVSVREFPTDVILGAQGGAATPASPQQVVATPEGPALVIRAPSPARQASQSQSTTAASGPCPAAHPFDAPKDEAPSRATTPPIPASYRYRNSGTYEYGQASSSNGGVLPAQSSRTIKEVQRLGAQQDSPYRFKIVEGLAGITTTTTYRVIPESNVPGEAGLFIERIETTRSSGSEDFSPQPMIKIFEFPAMGNVNWKSSGADPTNGSSMTIQGRIGIETPDGEDEGEEPDILTRARVDACGEVVDAWLVDIGGPSDTAKPDEAGGTVIGPGLRNLRFKAVYAIATQFGAFSVYDEYEITGTESDGQSVKLVNKATISEYPGLPR